MISEKEQASIYLFKVKNKNTRERCEVCPKLKIRALERCHRRRSGLFIVSFEHNSRLFLMFFLFALNK